MSNIFNITRLIYNPDKYRHTSYEAIKYNDMALMIQDNNESFPKPIQQQPISINKNTIRVEPIKTLKKISISSHDSSDELYSPPRIIDSPGDGGAAH